MKLIKLQRLGVEDNEVIANTMLRSLAEEVAGELEHMACGHGKEKKVIVTIEVYE